PAICKALQEARPPLDLTLQAERMRHRPGLTRPSICPLPFAILGAVMRHPKLLFAALLAAALAAPPAIAQPSAKPVALTPAMRKVLDGIFAGFKYRPWWPSAMFTAWRRRKICMPPCCAIRALPA